MQGLDQVKGPHWSQILSLYGISGTLNNVLKERNQVQLKDKARNLKLFFLKSDIEVPFYLQTVTGELKTRAPSQAARREAEERARLSGEEEQARIEGIYALNGMQNHSPYTGALSSSPAQSFTSHDGSEIFQGLDQEKMENEEVFVQRSDDQLLIDSLVAATAENPGNDQGNQSASGFTAVTI